MNWWDIFDNSVVSGVSYQLHIVYPFQQWFHHRRAVVPPSVNGDIAIQWEWSNFDHSQKPNPLTDYGKTLHNWLSPRDERVTQTLCQSAVRERLTKYVKYKASSFLILIFSTYSPTEVTCGWISRHNDSKHALWRKDVPFGGQHDGRQHFRVKISPKLSKMAFYRYVLASANGLKTNDVIAVDVIGVALLLARRHWSSGVYYL